MDCQAGWGFSRFFGRKRIGTYNSLGVVSTGGGEEAEQVLSVKDDYVGVTTIDAQATRTGPGPEGPGTRPKAKPGSKVGGGGEPCTAFNWRRRGGGELEQRRKEVRRVIVNCGAKPDRARGKHGVTFDRPPATFGRVRR